MIDMERKIGEIFEYNGEWYQCIRSSDCSKCYFHHIEGCRIKFPCESLQREDCEEVIFKKLKKVGKPVTVKGRTFQKLTSDDSCSCAYCAFNIPNKECYKTNYIDSPCPDNEVWIEIKQNKKDMKEKKLNLKPFNLEAAKQGKPVCTRDGRKARIICFDKKDIYPLFDKKDIYPLIALITNEDGYEILTPYKADGAHPLILNNDLMMLLEKKEGWINIYNADTTFYYVDGMVYNTKDEAIQKAKEEIITEQREKSEYVDTVKIFWEK